MERTLVLNSSYQPINVINWRRAITMLFLNKVEVIEEYDREVRSVSLSLRVPSVLRVINFIPEKRIRKRLKLTRTNVFIRDRYRCQYCGKEFPASELTLDHVIPLTRGGDHSWENLVTACKGCNNRKGARTPSEAGMKLLREPRVPSYFVGSNFLIDPAYIPQTWRVYLCLQGAK
ncbi:MAG: HNH endonuclease [Acidobacteria bacterium]|nr:HNH endonuclease [Acidobacteriota bacterium]